MGKLSFFHIGDPAVVAMLASKPCDAMISMFASPLAR